MTTAKAQQEAVNLLIPAYAAVTVNTPDAPVMEAVNIINVIESDSFIRIIGTKMPQVRMWTDIDNHSVTVQVR